jgi:4-aminobutyrate aminotransferase-like enzyme
VETNFVGLELGPLGMDVAAAIERLREHGIRVGFLRPGVLRIATYLGVTDEDVDRAIDAIPQALGAVVRA